MEPLDLSLVKREPWEKNVDSLNNDLTQLCDGTRRQTVREVKRFLNFLKSLGEDRQPEDIPPGELDIYLVEYIPTLQKYNGEEYQHRTVCSYIRGLDRYLKIKGYTKSVIQDPEFTRSRKVLEENKSISDNVIGQFGPVETSTKSDILTEDEEDVLWITGVLGGNNPKSLRNAIWFVISKYFGITFNKDHYSLCWGNLKEGTDAEGKSYVKLTFKGTAVGLGIINEINLFPKHLDIKVFEKPDPTRCPVRLYRLYREKRPLDFCRPRDPLYLCINYNSSPNGKWYSRIPMGLSSIAKFMPKMAEEAGLGKKVNVSVKKKLRIYHKPQVPVKIKPALPRVKSEPRETPPSALDEQESESNLPSQPWGTPDRSVDHYVSGSSSKTPDGLAVCSLCSRLSRNLEECDQCGHNLYETSTPHLNISTGEPAAKTPPPPILLPVTLPNRRASPVSTKWPMPCLSPVPPPVALKSDPSPRASPLSKACPPLHSAFKAVHAGMPSTKLASSSYRSGGGRAIHLVRETTPKQPYQSVTVVSRALSDQNRMYAPGSTIPVRYVSAPLEVPPKRSFIVKSPNVRPLAHSSPFAQPSATHPSHPENPTGALLHAPSQAQRAPSIAKIPKVALPSSKTKKGSDMGSDSDIHISGATPVLSHPQRYSSGDTSPRVAQSASPEVITIQPLEGDPDRCRDISLEVYQVRMGLHKYAESCRIVFKDDGLLLTSSEHSPAPLHLKAPSIVSCKANLDPTHPVLFITLEETCVTQIQTAFNIAKAELNPTAFMEVRRSITVFPKSLTTEQATAIEAKFKVMAAKCGRMEAMFIPIGMNRVIDIVFGHGILQPASGKEGTTPKKSTSTRKRPHQGKPHEQQPHSEKHQHHQETKQQSKQKRQEKDQETRQEKDQQTNIVNQEDVEQFLEENLLKYERIKHELKDQLEQYITRQQNELQSADIEDHQPQFETKYELQPQRQHPHQLPQQVQQPQQTPHQQQPPRLLPPPLMPPVIRPTVPRVKIYHPFGPRGQDIRSQIIRPGNPAMSLSPAPLPRAPTPSVLPPQGSAVGWPQKALCVNKIYQVAQPHDPDGKITHCVWTGTGFKPCVPVPAVTSRYR